MPNQQSDAGGIQPRRGRRDPALAAQLDSAPPARRRRQPPGTVERTIDHVPESEYEPPVPEIPMDDPDDMLSESGEQNPDELPALYDGAVVMVRISKTPLLPDGEMWVAMGAQDRVQVDESAQSASERISDFVVSELEYVTDKALATHQEAERQRAAERAEALRQPRSRVRRS